MDVGAASALGYSQARSVFGNAGIGAGVQGPAGSIYAISTSYLASIGLPAGLTVEELGRKVVALAKDVQALWDGPRPVANS
ncbi:hypothetical protein D3C87_1976950 [compost metagenome]